MTKRQAIAADIVTYLSAITILGGYKNNFPVATHWKTFIDPKENELVVNVKDRANNYSNTDDGLTETLAIEINLGCSVTGLNYTTISNMIDDIYKCIHTNRRTLEIDFHILDIIPVSDELAVDQFEREVGAGKVVFNFIHEKHADWIYDETSY